MLFNIYCGVCSSYMYVTCSTLINMSITVSARKMIAYQIYHPCNPELLVNTSLDVDDDPDVCCLLHLYLSIYRPFRAFICDIDRPPEKCYSVAAIEPSLKIKVATFRVTYLNIPQISASNSSPFFSYRPIKSGLH